jgi:hypothetical protein
MAVLVDWVQTWAFRFTNLCVVCSKELHSLTTHTSFSRHAWHGSSIQAALDMQDSSVSQWCWRRFNSSVPHTFCKAVHHYTITTPFHFRHSAVHVIFWHQKMTSWHTAWYWENWRSSRTCNVTGSHLNPVFCTVHWACNSGAEGAIHTYISIIKKSFMQTCWWQNQMQSTNLKARN